ncbi:MAG: DNA gyrase C-terminal beta-propeller domain-containing protein, partial [Pseudomonadota bacterium]
EELDIMFATRKGTVRRNKLSDFVRVNRNGKIAMKLEEDGEDGIVSVKMCSDKDDILLTTALGQCIRFRVDDVRVFAGRNSTGVRGIKLVGGDRVISMAILRHVEVTPAEARAYLKHASAMRRATEGEEEDLGDDAGEEAVDETALSPERLAELGAAEQFLLTVTTHGMGKRSSAFDYRVSGRGGKGIIAHRLPMSLELAQSFTIEDGDEVMLVTDAGQLIRTPVDQIRVAGRATSGVWVLRTNAGEKVVSVARLVEQDEDDIEDGEGAPTDAGE